MPLFIIRLWRKKWIKTLVAIVGGAIVFFLVLFIHNSQIDDNQFRLRLESRGNVAR